MARRKLSEDLKLIIIDKYKDGILQIDIAKSLNINKSIVSRLISKFRSTQSVKTLPRCGRPRATTQRTDSLIARTSKIDPFITPNRICSELNLKISSRTIQRRLVEQGLFSRRPVKKPAISKKNKKARLEFAHSHLNWTREDWSKVLFSDESKFNLKNSDGMNRVRRPNGNRMDPRYGISTYKHGGGSIMVWGCFSANGTGPLHKINGIMDRIVYKDILQDIMLPFAELEMPPGWIYQQDNDPKHTAKLVKEWFSVEKVEVMSWPAQSPDINPIENLWEIVNQRFRKETITNQDQLFYALKAEWDNIPISIISNLIDSMPRRLQAVIANNGYSTKY